MVGEQDRRQPQACGPALAALVQQRRRRLRQRDAGRLQRARVSPAAKSADPRCEPRSVRRRHAAGAVRSAAPRASPVRRTALPGSASRNRSSNAAHRMRVAPGDRRAPAPPADRRRRGQAAAARPPPRRESPAPGRSGPPDRPGRPRRRWRRSPTARTAAHLARAARPTPRPRGRPVVSPPATSAPAPSCRSPPRRR